MKCKEVGYAIWNKELGLYEGWCQDEEDVIYHHCRDLGCDWDDCLGHGDRVVQVTLKYRKPRKE